MMKRYLMYVGLCFLAFLGSRCSLYQDASTPPKSSVQVDKASGLSEQTVFTFTVTGVTADAVALLPMGTGTEGVTVSGFTNGTAIVKYTYTHVGTFSAVVVTSNFSPDGKSIKRTVSDPITVTVTSNTHAITDFSFDKSSSTTITGNAINVVLPYDPWGNNSDGKHDITKAVASFSASPHSTVTVGGVAQASGTTANNFTSAVTYTVTAADNSSQTYTVTTTTTPVSTDNTVKSAKVKVASYLAKDKTYNAYVDNTNHNIVVILPYSAGPKLAVWADSLKLNVTLNDGLASAKLGGKKFAQDTLVDISAAKSQVLTVKAQSGATQDYKVVTVAAPNVVTAWNDLDPTVNGVTSDFVVTMTGLKGTDFHALRTTFSIVPPDVNSVLASQVTISNNDQKGGTTTVSPGDVVLNYSDVGFAADTDQDHNVGTPLPFAFWVTATIGSASYTYQVTYNVTPAMAK